MRKFLGMLFLIGMIGFSYGLSGPEPILDPIEFISSDVSQEVLPSFHHETVENWYILASVPDYSVSPISKIDHAVSLKSLEIDDFPDGMLSKPVLAVRGRGDIVIEQDKHKARDRYRLPIWDYEPIAEPPANLL